MLPRYHKGRKDIPAPTVFEPLSHKEHCLLRLVEIFVYDIFVMSPRSIAFMVIKLLISINKHPLKSIWYDIYNGRNYFISIDYFPKSPLYFPIYNSRNYFISIDDGHVAWCGFDLQQ